MSLGQIILNTVITFIIVYVLSRILGKKLISQMTFFDFVAGVSLGSLVGSVILAKDISIWKANISLVVFAAITLLVEYIALNSFKGRKILNDVPTIVIKDGKILADGMRKCRLTMDDLLFQLRKKSIFYLDEVEYALLETDGTVSALKKADKQTPTANDLQIAKKSRGLPHTFIIDGNIVPNSLSRIGKDEGWLNEIIRKHNSRSVKNIIVAQIDDQQNIYVSKKE